ncbi:MAG TPA: hypothetical protein VGB55_05490, partial [Tepidisphaeraceae bacterium]
MRKFAAAAWKFLCHQSHLRAVRDQRSANAWLFEFFQTAVPAGGVAPVESLETRRMLSITPSLSAGKVTFASSNDADLYLRSNAGVLEYSETGSSWSSDLDASASGINTLSLTSGVTVDAQFEGTMRLQQILTGGGAFTVNTLSNVSVNGNLITSGGAASITTTGDFTLSGAHLISTRRIGLATDHSIAASTGNSGKITLRGQHLTLASGSYVLAQGTGAFTSGAIEVIAAESASSSLLGSLNQWTKTADSAITTNATIKGGAVKLYSVATTDADFNDNTSEYGLDGEVPPSTFNVPDAMKGITAFIGLSIAKSTSVITIGSGSNIIASVIDVQSGAQTEARVLTTAKEKQLAFALGMSTPTARIDVQRGANLSSSGDLSLNSIANSTVSVSAKRGLLGPAKSDANQSVTIAASVGDIESNVNVAAGASLNSDSGSVTVKAKMVKDHNTGASAGAYEDGTFGAALAVSLSESDTTAEMDGMATAGQNVSVLAESLSNRVDTSTSSGVGSGLGARLVLGVKGAAGSAASTTASKQPDQNPKAGGARKLAVSAAFTYAEDTNNAVARVGNGATAIAKNGDLRVDSTV